nr:hypothetical protein [Tanacetum cinerariifolium]
MVYARVDGLALFINHAWRRLFEVRVPLVRLHSEEEMAEAGFGAYWSGSERVIPNKGDLRDYWMDISSNRNFLGPAPSYVYIKDPVRRLCHMMIACSNSGRRQGP